MLDVPDADILVEVGAVVPPPGSVETGAGPNADRTVCGETIATPMAVSATAATMAITTLATRNRSGTDSVAGVSGDGGYVPGA